MKIWLTYAWKDNEKNDVDHIISKLGKAGLEVGYDKVQLLAGRRLWDQIDVAIKSPDVAAWAIYVTENSLKSEPCQEELAYALDRTLRTKGSAFPLIGLFSGDFDSTLIPSALATRLCVNLQHNEWDKQVSDAVVGINNAIEVEPQAFGYKLHEVPTGFVLEVWPRTGTWTPTIAVVSERDEDILTSHHPGPRGFLGGVVAYSRAERKWDGYFGRMFTEPVNSSRSAHIYLSKLPKWIMFGQMGSPHRLEF
ncbi:TIR domain protein [Sphingobium sp. RAC03]|nr:TIR domain protein [Sphingobium sp. RAC03]